MSDGVDKPERVTQARVIALFRDELGYAHLADELEGAGYSDADVLRIRQGSALRHSGGREPRRAVVHGHHGSEGVLMATHLQLGDIRIDVELKDIKNVHLSVHPPTGRVRISAPRRMDLEAIRLFAISKLAWIRTQQRKLREQERETPRDFLTRESHYVWGARRLLSVIEAEARPGVELSHRRMVLRVRPGAGRERRRQVVEEWRRGQVRVAAEELVALWQPRVGVELAGIYVRRMKTRWGSCNPAARTIRLNTALACKPPQCLEYIVIHEMLHVLEPTHSERFLTLMDRFLPDWEQRRQVLNRLPLSHQRERLNEEKNQPRNDLSPLTGVPCVIGQARGRGRGPGGG